MTTNFFLGDCLEVLPTLEENSIDAVLSDPPYGKTGCDWDTIIPIKPMWEALNRVLKPSGVVILFSTQPFASQLIVENLPAFKHEWIWDKKIPSGPFSARYRPMRQHENILVFCSGSLNYYPQMSLRDNPIKQGGMNEINAILRKGGKPMKPLGKTYTHKFPTTLLSFDKIRKGSKHPTQKPVPLLEYLLKTYTQEGEVVLDFAMGSGSTGVACANLGRDFVGIEIDENYFKIAQDRINP